LRERLEHFKESAKKAVTSNSNTPYWSERTYVTSGHYAKYGADQPISNSPQGRVFIKPMNCPSSLKYTMPLVLQRFTKRYAEFGTVYRYEQSGELQHGLLRTRIFCTQNNWTKSSKK
jgi:threonyl-tRNA synthetase